MFRDDNHIKDTSSGQNLALKDMGILLSYKKTNKLISALYMVTDIMDKDEPLRSKLRNMGLELISDTHTDLFQAERKIYEILSLLDIASSISLISEMNHSILRKEFIELENSIKSFKNPSGRAVSLEDFLKEEEREKPTSPFSVYQSEPIGRNYRTSLGTRIGVQKGGTLLKALSDKTDVLDFNLVKKQRRQDIISILKDNPGGATITIITSAIKDRKVASLMSSGEKTLQRELISMVKDGVLSKTGEKRWSRYSLPK